MQEMQVQFLVRKIPWGGTGNPLQYSCLKNPMDKGAWQAPIHGVAKSQIWLSNWAHMHTYNHVILETQYISHYIGFQKGQT